MVNFPFYPPPPPKKKDDCITRSPTVYNSGAKLMEIWSGLKQRLTQKQPPPSDMNLNLLFQI